MKICNSGNQRKLSEKEQDDMLNQIQKQLPTDGDGDGFVLEAKKKLIAANHDLKLKSLPDGFFFVTTY